VRARKGVMTETVLRENLIFARGTLVVVWGWDSEKRMGGIQL